MPLWLLGPLVVAGIALVVWVVNRTGGRSEPRFADLSSAQSGFLAHYPDAKVGAVMLASDGSAALLALDDGRAGITVPVGRYAAARLFDPMHAHIDVHGDMVSIDLSDPAFPARTLRFADTDAARATYERIFQIRDKAHA